MTDWPRDHASGEVKSSSVFALAYYSALNITALDGKPAFSITALDVTAAIAALFITALLFIPAVALAAPSLEVSALNVGPVFTFALEHDGGQFTIFLLTLRFPFLYLTLARLLCFDALRKRVVLASCAALRFVCSCGY